MGFSIFVPGVDTPDPNALHQVGLSGLLRQGEAGPEAFRVHACQALGQRSGMLFLWRPPAGQVSHAPDSKRWLPWPREGEPRWLLGLEQAGLTPAMASWKTVVPGEQVLLTDHQLWTIPRRSALPCRHGLDARGKWRRTVDSRFRDFAERCDHLLTVSFQAMGSEDELRRVRPELPSKPVEFTIEEADAFACQALAINYRLTPEIVDLLGLLDDVSMTRIVWAAVELPRIAELILDGEEVEHTLSIQLQ